MSLQETTGKQPLQVNNCFDCSFLLQLKHLRLSKTKFLTILAGIEAGERCSEHLHKVAHAPQVLVHVPEVSVDVITIPEIKRKTERKKQKRQMTTFLLKPL